MPLIALSPLNSVAVTDLAGRQHYGEFHWSAGCTPEICETRVLGHQ